MLTCTYRIISSYTCCRRTSLPFKMALEPILYPAPSFPLSLHVLTVRRTTSAKHHPYAELGTNSFLGTVPSLMILLRSSRPQKLILLRHFSSHIHSEPLRLRNGSAWGPSVQQFFCFNFPRTLRPEKYHHLLWHVYSRNIEPMLTILVYGRLSAFGLTW